MSPPARRCHRPTATLCWDPRSPRREPAFAVYGALLILLSPFHLLFHPFLHDSSQPALAAAFLVRKWSSFGCGPLLARVREAPIATSCRPLVCTVCEAEHPVCALQAICTLATSTPSSARRRRTQLAPGNMPQVMGRARGCRPPPISSGAIGCPVRPARSLAGLARAFICARCVLKLV